MSRINVANFRHPDGTSDNISLDDSGRVLVGTSSVTGNQGDGELVLQGASQGELYLTRGSATASTNSGLGFINFTGDNGADSATIKAYSDGSTWTSGSSHPSRLQFSTTADGASTPTERMRLDSAGNLKFNSGYGSVATAYGVRAWINFDGTSGSIGTGDANGNISGVTDLGTGDYTIAIDNDMPDANYVIAGHVNAHQAWGGMVINARADGSVGTKTAGSFSLATIDGDSARDYTDVGVLVIR